MNALLDYLQAFGGRAKGLLSNPQNYLAEILQSLPDRNSLQGAVKDPEFYKGLLSNTKEMAGGLLTGAVGAPVDIATMMMRPGGYNVPDRNVVGSSNHLAGLLGLDAESTPYKVGSLLPTDAGDAAKYMGLLGQVAWHGSPHKFDKFKLDKIGTGEGAQAYGHGLYFAENPKVAQSYADNLAPVQVRVNGQTFAGNTPEAQAATLIRDKGGKDQALAFMQEHLERIGSFPASPRNDSMTAAARTVMQKIDELSAAQHEIIGKGTTYKVDIADDAIPKMLDWDKPLSEQPTVLKALEGLAKHDKVWARGLANNPGMTGEQLYRSLSNVEGGGAGQWNQPGIADAASKTLRELGIPGIRYLDGASRGKGGTSNFVLFDDELVKILERQ